MIKIFLFIIFIGLCSLGYGQGLTFSSEFSSFQKDDNVPKIAKVWEEYVNSIISRKPDSERADMWVTGTNDILRYTSRTAQIYLQGQQYTFNIRKLNDSIYEINTISWWKAPNYSRGVVDYIYRVCATNIDGEFKLLSYFDVIKHTLNNHMIDCIDYYYPQSFNFKKKDAEKTAAFVRDFKSKYNIIDNNIITFIAANSLDECNSILGLTFTSMRSEKTYAGRAMYPRTLLSARVDHIHELVHAIMIPIYPAAPSVLHEGIATFYGGGYNKDYSYHKVNLKRYLLENSIDFSNESNINKLLEGETSLSNTFGALIIEFVLKNYGETKVLELFESKNYQQIFLKLELSKNEINDFVLNKLILK